MEIMKNYWPLGILALWFLYKWLNSKKIVAMLPELKKQGALLIDVRSQSEFTAGHAPGTINIPLQELNSRLGEIPKTAPVVLCCASGTRSSIAKMNLKKNGHNRIYNIGSWTNFLN